MKFQDVLNKIENAKIGESVKLIAVSKNVTTKEVTKLYDQGQVDFGENRVQELKNKREILKNLAINWHFIGRLQSNKINQLLSLKPTLWQSCDSFKVALEVDKRLNYELECLLQINSAKEQSKQGVQIEAAVESFLEIKQNCKFLKPIGVMSIGAHVDELDIVAKSFE